MLYLIIWCFVRIHFADLALCFWDVVLPRAISDLFESIAWCGQEALETRILYRLPTWQDLWSRPYSLELSLVTHLVILKSNQQHLFCVLKVIEKLLQLSTYWNLGSLKSVALSSRLYPYPSIFTIFCSYCGFCVTSFHLSPLGPLGLQNTFC